MESPSTIPAKNGSVRSLRFGSGTISATEPVRRVASEREFDDLPEPRGQVGTQLQQRRRHLVDALQGRRAQRLGPFPQPVEPLAEPGHRPVLPRHPLERHVQLREAVLARAERLEEPPARLDLELPDACLQRLKTLLRLRPLLRLHRFHGITPGIAARGGATCERSQPLP